MTREDIKAELDARKVEYKGNASNAVLLETLNAAREAAGEEPAELDAKPDDKKPNTDAPVKVTMVANVKHGALGQDPVQYKTGESYELDEVTADLFKTQGWAK